jgi:hypothetical protein
MGRFRLLMIISDADAISQITDFQLGHFRQAIFDITPPLSAGYASRHSLSGYFRCFRHCHFS